MDNARKKEMLREYKETPQRAGVFAVVCGDRCWVGTSRNLEKSQNSLRFKLRSGGYPNADLQKPWNEKGADAFVHEILEGVKDDNALIIGELLKERETAWRIELAAQKLVG